jgi:uncharacterized membrane protein
MNTPYHWTPLIAAHTAAAVVALLIGAVMMALPKGTAVHRALGWGWVVLMASVALVSFGIHGEHYSWIHGLSVFTLLMLTLGVWHARRHRVRHHRKTMLGVYFGALVIAGLFTLLPSRLIGRALFSALGWH